MIPSDTNAFSNLHPSRNARKYCLDMVYKSYYDAGEQRISILAQRFKQYYKIPTHDRALNPDQWAHQKRKMGGGGIRNILATIVLKSAAFLPFTNEVGNKLI